MTDPVVPLTVAQTVVQETEAAHDSRLTDVLIAIDNLGNVIIGGSPDQTISTSAALAAQKHEVCGRVLSALLDHLQSNHGSRAAAGDLERAQAEVVRLQAAQIVNQ